MREATPILPPLSVRVLARVSITGKAVVQPPMFTMPSRIS